VLFVRNIPNDAIEEDLKRVFELYGPIEKVLIMIQKSHGFIEFKNIEDAKKCLNEVGVDNQVNNPESQE
jgi:RNA recognition motif-containing protein